MPTQPTTPKPALTPANKKMRASLRKLLSSKDLDTVTSGCVMLQAMTDDPDLRPIVEELADGTEVDSDGRLRLGDEVAKRAKAANRTMVALYALGASGGLEGVEKLDLSGSSLKNVDGIANLNNLTELSLYGCSSLQNIDGIAKLNNLIWLDLEYCSSLPASWQKEHSKNTVNTVDALRTKIQKRIKQRDQPALTPANKKIRASLRKLLSSKDLDTVTSGCVMLQAMADDPDLRPIIEELADGTEVDSDGNLKSGDEVEKRAKADNRTMVALYALKACGRLEGVEKLNLVYPDGLQNIDAIANLNNLTTLNLRYCHSLQNIDALAKLNNLTTLDLTNCSSLQNIDAIANLNNLTILDLRDCISLQNIDGLANLKNLTILHLAGCSSLQNIDAIANLNNLTTLNLRGCKSLQNIDGIANLNNLTELNLSGCSALQNIDGRRFRSNYSVY